MDPARATAVRFDAQDPLARYVDDFVVRDSSLIYFDGNSLGRLPRRTVRALDHAISAGWGGDLVRGWSGWVDLPEEVGNRVGAAALGASAGQVIACDSTSVNLFKLVSAAVDANPDRRVIVTDTSNFPTDRHVIAGIAETRALQIRWVDTDPVYGVLPDTVEAAMRGDVALATFSQVDYRSGAVADVEMITDVVHRQGALALWDLSHAAGAVPVELDGWGVDLAVGCGYKYLNGGPGAPAWLYVSRPLQERLVSPVWGWFGHHQPFDMTASYVPATGIRRWLAGTPPVLGLVALNEGVAMVEEAGIERIRAKGVALTAFATELAGTWLTPLGFRAASPADPARRGSHVALSHPEAYRLSRALLDAGVVPDFRPPDVLRVGLSPLTTRFTDVWDGLDRLSQLARAEAWIDYDPEWSGAAPL